MPILTREQQKDYARRFAEGCRFATDMQALEASERTEAERWRIADELLQDVDFERANRLSECESLEEHGLVIQQRRFMQLRRAR